MKEKERKFVRETLVSIVVCILILMMLTTGRTPQATAEPRTDTDVTFYASDSAAWTALVGGQADLIQGALTKEQKEAAEANPNIVITRVDEQGMYEFDLNNNYTILSYPGIRSATSELKVRQAIARLTDKDYIVANILLFFGARIDAPMAVSGIASWADPSVIGANYLYPYNPQEAANLLVAAGFSDTDHNGWLNYPASWDGAPGADTTTYPLVVCIRNDHSHRLSAGQYLINQLEVTLAGTTIGAGFKTTGTLWQQPRSVLNPKVMGNRDYQVYTGAWSLSRYPTHLFSLFSSMFWYPYGPNYVTGFDKDGNPNYPDVDAAVEQVWYTDSISTAEQASKHFTVLHAQKCITIPLWSYSSYWAYRKELLAVINMDGYGLDNVYTFLNAYRESGGPIRMAAVSGPDRLNILYSQWSYEYSFLNRVYTSAMNIEPYNLAVDVPWVVQDWTIGPWDDAGTTKTVCTYYIRKDVGIVAPVTGTFVRNFDARDFEFTVWYNYAFSDSWQWGSFMDVRYTKIADVNGDGWNEFQVYFDDQSYWFYTAPTYPLLTNQELLDPLNAQTTETWGQVGTAEHDLTNNVVQVVTCTLGGSPLAEGVDYRIDAGYMLSSHVGFVPLHDLTGAISITYWYADIPATGFYLGGLPWQQTMYSLGTHYPVAMTTDPPGIGDTAVLNRNMYFFLELPILGEVDWNWYWVGTTKPRSGYYKIDIIDRVHMVGASGTRGDGQYDPRFLPGADIAPPGGVIDALYDLLTNEYNYARTFGTPPSFFAAGSGESSSSDLDSSAYYPGPSASDPTVFIEPQNRIVGQNLTMTARIKIRDVASGNNLVGYLICLYYDRTLLSPVNAIEGPFLKSMTSTSFGVQYDDSYNATHGQVRILCYQIIHPAGTYGNGTLAEVTFNAAAEHKGTTALGIESQLATFAYYAAARAMVAFPISHSATGELVKVTIVGDVDGDGSVTIFDLVTITSIYNVYEGDPRFRPNADLDNNGVISIFDVVICTGHYGQKDP